MKANDTATIQISSLLITCKVKTVLRGGASAVLVDDRGEEFKVSRNRAGEYRYEKTYRVRLDDCGNRPTWLD